MVTRATTRKYMGVPPEQIDRMSKRERLAFEEKVERVNDCINKSAPVRDRDEYGNEVEFLKMISSPWWP